MYIVQPYNQTILATHVEVHLYPWKFGNGWSVIGLEIIYQTGSICKETIKINYAALHIYENI